MKQSLCVIAAMLLLLTAAGVAERNPGLSLLLTAAMLIPLAVGKLHKRRVTAAEVEKRYSDAKN